MSETKERIKAIAARKVIRHPESKPGQILKALEFLERRDARQTAADGPERDLERILAKAGE